MVILVVYSAWVYPFEVAFMNGSPKGGLCAVDSIIDLFFAVDIVLTFFVAYIDSRTQLLVHDRRKIAIRFVSKHMGTSFFLSFFFPLFLFTAQKGERTKKYTSYQLC